MSWADVRRRREILGAVLESVARNGPDRLPYAEISGASEVFPAPGDLLLALHHRWTVHLTARVEQAADDAGAETARAAAVRRAYLDLAAEQPGLRQLLDVQADDLELGPILRRAERAEHRMLAHYAGVADLGENADEAARAGRQFVELMRPASYRPRRTLLGRLLAGAS